MERHKKKVASAELERSGIGDAVRRREDQRLVTGQGCYGDDHTSEGQVYAVILRSPHAHATSVSIDAAQAKAQDGVLQILTHADYLADGLKSFPLRPKAMTPPDINLENSNGEP